MKKKVSGRFKEYSLIKKVKSDPDGDVYLVDGGQGEGLCAKLLSDHSYLKQSEVESSLQGSTFGSIMDVPLDIAFSRGKFVGYIYQNFDAWNQDSTPSQAASSSAATYITDVGSGSMGTGSLANGLTDNPLIKWGGLAVGVILLSLLNMKVLHGVFLNFVARMFSPQVLAGCEMLGFSGVTAIVIGLVAAGLLCTKISGADLPVFLVMELGGFLAGIILTDVLIVVAIQLIIGVVNILMAVIPVVVVVIILIVLVKSFFKR